MIIFIKNEPNSFTLCLRNKYSKTSKTRGCGYISPQILKLNLIKNMENSVNFLTQKGFNSDNFFSLSWKQEMIKKTKKNMELIYFMVFRVPIYMALPFLSLEITRSPLFIYLVLQLLKPCSKYDCDEEWYKDENPRRSSNSCS